MTAGLRQGKTREAHALEPGACKRGVPARFALAACLVLLAVINFLSFGKALDCYFLADDLVPLSYLFQIFHGHPELLLTKLCSPWQDANVQLLYRPFIELTMAADYAVWGASPFGFHLSNIAYHITSAFLLFFIARRLLSTYGHWQATAAAFFAAALFSVSPLHGETVVWMIGRVDSICTCFYLLSFWLFIQAEDSGIIIWRRLSLAAFAVGLLSKEMAVTLPLCLAWYCFVLVSEGPWRQRLIESLKKTLSFWLALIPFFLIRILVLGTPAGGYVGSLGEMCASSSFQRWVSSGTLWKIIYPFNERLLTADSPSVAGLHLLYLAAGALILWRSALCPWDRRVMRLASFSGGWFLISMIPTYQVLYFNVALSGGRFLYLGSSALSLLLVVLLYPFAGAGRQERAGWRVFSAASLVLLGGFVACLASIAGTGNNAWLSASRQTQGLRDAIVETVATLPAQRKMAVVNLSKAKDGAHLMYSYHMLECLLKPPLASKDVAARVVSLQPSFYRDELLNLSLLKRLIAGGDCSFYCFDDRRLKLVPLDLRLPVKGLCLGDKLTVSGPAMLESRRGRFEEYAVAFSRPLETMAVDFVEITVCARLVAGARKLAPDDNVASLSWRDDRGHCFGEPCKLEIPLADEEGDNRYRFALSERKGWILAGTVGGVVLSLPAGRYQYQLKSVGLVDAAREIPVLSPDRSTLNQNNDSSLSFKGDSGRFFYDACRIPGAVNVIVEVTKAKSCFEHYATTLRESRLCARSMRRFNFAGARGAFTLTKQIFPEPSTYQLRLAAKDAGGRMLGYVSDPLSLSLEKNF